MTTGPGQLVVMSYNIRHGENAVGCYDLEGIAEVIRAQRPCVVALQEVDRRWGARSGFDDQPARLAALTGMTACYGPNLDRGGAQYGNLILSRHPVSAYSSAHLPRLADSNEQRGMVSALIETEDGGVRFFATHLQHNSAVERAAQVRAILEAVEGSTEPVIVAGDFNAQPHQDELRPLLERLVDAWAVWEAETPEAGPGHTIPSTAPRSRIDYVFVPKGTRVLRASVPSTPASDHLPVVVTLAHPGVSAGDKGTG